MTKEYLNWKIDVTDGLEAYDELANYNINCIAEDEAVYVSVKNFNSAKSILREVSLLINKD